MSAGLRRAIQQDLVANTGVAGRRALVKAVLVSHSFQTVLTFRLSSALHCRGPMGRAISKWLWLRNIKRSSCHISPRAVVGSGLCLPHATGIVIGDGVVIGERATIYQNVTLGTARRSGPPMYPRLGDDVQVYANAVVFGAITIGHRAKIGAGLVVSFSVPDGAVCKSVGNIRAELAHA